MLERLNFENPYKLSFAALSLLLIFLLPVLSFDAPFTDDEGWHMEHGQRIFDYYQGKDTIAIAHPFDKDGVWLTNTEGTLSKPSHNIYGGFTDLLPILLYPFLSPSSLDIYEFKHVIISIFGALLIIFTGLLAYRISDNWKIGLLTLILGSTSPRIIGHSFNNMLDISFAMFFVFGLFQIISLLKELPRLKPQRIILTALSISLATAVRSGGMILIGYLFLAVGLWALINFLFEEISFKQIIKIALITAVIAIAGYLGCSLVWPWASLNPILNPFRSLMAFKNITGFNSMELFEGKWINYFEIPWYFVPKTFYIIFPAAVTIGFVLYFIYLPKIWRANKATVIANFILVFSVLFPIASIIINKSNVYDDGRHVLFIIPEIIALAGIAWFFVFNNIKTRLLKLTTLLAFGYMIYEPLAFMVRNHPHEVMYFSPFISGPKGAFKNFEMDYWGFSARAGLQWIEANDTTLSENHKARVRLWYGEQRKIKYFTDKSTKLQYVLAPENSTDWDYSIQLPVESKYNHDLLYHWPPPGTVYQVTVDSTPLCAVIKNWRVSESAGNSNNPIPVNNTSPAAGFIANGLSYYKAKNFNLAILEFKRGLLVDNRNLLLVNNIVASLNELQMFDDAIAYADKGLKIDPKYQLLLNNREVSAKGKQALKYDERYFIGLSYNYFVQKEFEKCISAAKQILKYNPTSSAAYNNICSAYNELEQFQKALDACDKGLKLAPNEQILKNNKMAAERGLKLP